MDAWKTFSDITRNATLMVTHAKQAYSPQRLHAVTQEVLSRPRNVRNSHRVYRSMTSLFEKNRFGFSCGVGGAGVTCFFWHCDTRRALSIFRCCVLGAKMGGLHLPVSLRVFLIVCRMTKRMCVSLLSSGPVPGFQVHGSLLFTTQCMCL